MSTETKGPWERSAALPHSPAPWHYGSTGEIYATDSDRPLAAVLRSPCLANVRLIAAAPDLLEALRALDEGPGCWCQHVESAQHTDACNLARAALTRATGAEP